MIPSSSPDSDALILKFGQIGDVIMAIPAVKALHDQGYAIHWAAGRAAFPLLKCYSWIDVLPVDDKAILVGSTSDRLRGIADLWRKVIPRRFDLCATLYYDSRFRLLAAPVRSKRKLVLSRQSRENALLAGRHHVDEYARVLLGEEDGYRQSSRSPVRPDLLPPSPWSKPEGTRRIGLFPGGTSNVLGQQTLRRWPIEAYVLLVKQLLERGWEIVLLGGPEDAWIGPHFEGLAVQDAIGSFTLPEVIVACDTCDAVITHDTGPLHLAGLSTTSIVGIFGPTDPATRVPRRPSVVGIWGGQGFACRPCYDGRDFAPCTFNGCMHQVTPALVLRELDQLLEERERGERKPWRVVCPEGTSRSGSAGLVNLSS